MSIEGAVSGVAGVDSVEVGIDTKTVDVAFDAAVVDLDKIVAAIEEVGYDVDR
jgi:copper chaperone